MAAATHERNELGPSGDLWETMMENLSPNPSAGICPKCRSLGREIPRKVLYQHLDARGILDIFQWRENWVCLNPVCECLYYSESQWISHKRCVKPVGFKEKGPDRVYCYCFGYTAGEILQKVDKGQTGPVLEQIKEFSRKGTLLCEGTNPSGQCCLDMVLELIEKRPN